MPYPHGQRVYGQSTAFLKPYIKSNVLIMGENKPANEARYIHGTYGFGFWTFYGGHDPEDYRHYVGDPPTDLSLHPSSPGFRLILNNILFPAPRKNTRKRRPAARYRPTSRLFPLRKKPGFFYWTRPKKPLVCCLFILTSYWLNGTPEAQGGYLCATIQQ
jgi:hypothetical protein